MTPIKNRKLRPLRWDMVVTFFVVRLLNAPLKHS